MFRNSCRSVEVSLVLPRCSTMLYIAVLLQCYYGETHTTVLDTPVTRHQAAKGAPG